MKKSYSIIKWLKRITLSILSLLIIYLLFVFIFSHIPYNTDFKATPNGTPVFLKSNGVHTDFIVPIKTPLMDWNEFIPNIPPQSNYIAFGWGDKGFYLNTPTWDDLTFSTAFKAASGLSTTAMHIDFSYNTPKESATCQGTTLSDAEYLKLCDYIKNSFDKNEQGELTSIPFDPRYYSGAFYDAKGTYSIFKSCNSWVNKGCKQTGIPTCFWTPLDQPLINSLNGY
ncbi:MAG: TIGR02117 family protein [Cytophagaceae bacterium]